MFGGRQDKGRCPIGLDVGAHSIKLVQLSHSGGRWEIAASASDQIPADLPERTDDRVEVIGGLTRRLIGSAAFHGRGVVSSLPTSAVQYRNLRLPTMPAEELRAAVEWEASDRFGIDPADGAVQFINAGTVGQGADRQQEVILITAAREVVEEHLQVLTRCGLKPVAIDADAGALGRLMVGSSADGKGTGTVAVVDMGYSSTKVLIVRRGQVRFFKPIEIGGAAFDALLAERLGVGLEEASRRRLNALRAPDPGGQQPADADAAVVDEASQWLSRELSRELVVCQRYFNVTFRGGGIDSVVLVGGESRLPRLCERMQEATGLRVGTFASVGSQEDQGSANAARLGNLGGRWAVAAGLSMRGSIKAIRRNAA